MSKPYRMVAVVCMDDTRMIVVLDVENPRRVVVVHVEVPKNGSGCACGGP